MTFADLATGDAVFLDANTIVYDFGPHPTFGPACKSLLNRIENGDFVGFISAPVFNDVAHRLMTLEACQTLGWPYPGIAQRLRRHSAEIQKLTKSRQALDEILRIGIQVLPVDSQQVLAGADLCRQYGLLSGDGLILAVMHRHGLSRIASNDADFDTVPGITRYAPV